MSESVSEPDIPIPGRATANGTRRFADRFVRPMAGRPARASEDHFTRPDELWLSSIALGTLRGEPGGVDDLLYRSVVGDLLDGGVNVFDTALSDRFQTSERAIGHALRRAIREGRARRDEIVVVSKGGALTPDPDRAHDYASAQRDLYASYIDTGLLAPDRIHKGFSIAPAFLLDQIERSRRNLGLETIDYYLIQEPEVQLKALGVDGFRDALEAAFAALEEAVERGWIGAYGLATWEGFLVPDSDRSHLGLVDVFQAALDVGQADHHLRAIQLPYGLAMGEGVALASQLGPDGHSRAILESLDRTGTVVFASAPLYGGRLVGQVPAFVRRAFPEAPSDATAALQFVRSTRNVSCAVVGMRDAAHVEDNLRLARVPRCARAAGADVRGRRPRAGRSRLTRGRSRAATQAGPRSVPASIDYARSMTRENRDPAESTGDVTGLLRIAGRDGDAADRLWALVYPELRRRAAQLVRNERTDHTLSATAVVNEAYVRLSSRMAHEWEDRSHFYNVASGIMRHVLIDHARRHRADKRGGGAPRQELDESVFPSVRDDDEGFRVAEQALETLAEDHERASLVVTLKVFGGLTIAEIAREVKVAERTVKNDWALARERLAEILAPA